MKRTGYVEPTRFPAVHYVPAIAILAFAIAKMVWATAKTELAHDIKPLVNVSAGIVGGSAGYVWGSITVHLAWRQDSRRGVVVQALSGAAFFLLMMRHPLYGVTAPSLASLHDDKAPQPVLTIMEHTDLSVVSAGIPDLRATILPAIDGGEHEQALRGYHGFDELRDPAPLGGRCVSNHQALGIAEESAIH